MKTKEESLHELFNELVRNIENHDLWKEYVFQKSGDKVYESRDACLMDIVEALYEEAFRQG